jgi:hypothetical protein
MSDLVAVDREVAVADQLAGVVTGRAKPARYTTLSRRRLEDAQQVLAGLAGARLASS